MAVMLPAVTLGDQHFDLLADQILASVSEQLLRLGVNLDDVAIAIDRHNSVGQRFQQIGKLEDLRHSRNRGFGSWLAGSSELEHSLFLHLPLRNVPRL